MTAVTSDPDAIGAAMARSVLHRLGALEDAGATSMEPDLYRSRQSVGPIGTDRT
jgi:hypothetical protein